MKNEYEVKRTSAVETFPYYALGNKDSANHVSFVFPNRYIVSVDLGKRWRAHCPLVGCADMDTGEVIVKQKRMTETKLAMLLAEIAAKKNQRLA
jgi:hypothetical protein